MADAERFVDRLPANNSYTGGAARVYDAWMPPGTVFDDDIVHQETLRRAAGTGLELASGNGRFLIPALEAGLDVQGIDNSPAMLEICQRHATERGLDVVLHEGDVLTGGDVLPGFSCDVAQIFDGIARDFDSWDDDDPS